jgi:hypothetical protein
MQNLISGDCEHGYRTASFRAYAPLKFDSPQRASTSPISKPLARASTPQNSDSFDRTIAPPREEFSPRFTKAQYPFLSVPNCSRPLVPLYQLKQLSTKSPQEEIQRLSLTELFQNSTTDYPRSSRFYQSSRDAINNGREWLQQVTDEVNGHMRPTNIFRS